MDVKCNVGLPTENVDQRSFWLVSAPCRLDQHAITSPSMQQCAEGQCSSHHQFYVIAIILVILCGLATGVWLIACWRRPKAKYIKLFFKSRQKPTILTSSSSCHSSRSSNSLPTPMVSGLSLGKATALNKTLTDSVGHSLDAPDLDALIREHAEIKQRLDIDEISATSLKQKSEILSPTYTFFKSIDSNVIEFPSLDDLPEPPHITVSEIHELNKALNEPGHHTLIKPLKRTATSNSVLSSITNKTMDPIQRRCSIASTVDFRPPVLLKNLVGLHSLEKTPFPADQLGLFSRLSTASSSSSLDITTSGDKKLYALLQDLRKTTAQKEAEVAKAAAENDSKWLKILSNS